MREIPLHSWSLISAEAIRLQAIPSSQLTLRWDRRRKVQTVAGVDVSVRDNVSRAAIIVLSYPELRPLHAVTAEAKTAFPYVPGLLTFREGPIVLEAWSRLPAQPDLVLFDGQGIAHPRRIGLAALLGLWLNVPTIGCAKSRLLGAYQKPAASKGDTSDLLDEHAPAKATGAVVRTRSSVKPLFISPGHLIDVPKAIEFALACCSRYRLPEPTRWAHRVSRVEAIPRSPARAKETYG